MKMGTVRKEHWHGRNQSGSCRIKECDESVFLMEEGVE